MTGKAKASTPDADVATPTGSDAPVVTTPPVIAHPNRRALRTAFQTALGILGGILAIVPLVPDLVHQLPPHWGVYLAPIVAAAAGISRVMAIPAVDAFLRRHKLLSALSAFPPPPDE